MIGLWAFSRALVAGWPRWIFLIAVAVLPGSYFNLQLAYAEVFFNARPAAEGIVLLGLAAVFTGRWKSAAMLALLAAAVHPLVAAGGWLAGGWYLVLKDRRWLAAAVAAGALGVGLAAAGVDPFKNLFVWFDPLWEYLSTMYLNVAFLRMLGAQHWALLAWSTTTVLMAYRIAPDRERKVLFALGCSAVSGYLITFVGGDLLGNVLVTQLQLHRVLWLFQLVSYLALARILWTALAAGEVALIAVTWLLTARVLPSVGGSLILLAGFLAFWFLREQKLPVWIRSAGWLPLPLWAAGGLATAILVRLPEPTLEDFSFRAVDPHLVRLAFCVPSMLLMLVAVLVLAWKNPSAAAGAKRTLVWSSIALLFAAALFWDQRSPALSQLERRYGQQRLLRNIDPAAEVYWDDRHLMHLWFLAGHTSYVSALQGSGMIFSREMAMEWLRRMEVVRGEVAGGLPPDTITAPPVAPGALGQVCRKDSGLDYIITSSPGQGEPVPFEVAGTMFYLNDCASYRRPTE